ncbi:uncharacterized protein TNCV_477731 [Trichonephila clavipes]|nr:uncharacterized protein TNCV_477731 [Trichonephila clavipes]
MKLCDKDLLNKCLHGKTQNANESFNGILWKFIPKDIFVELQTLKLGAHMAVIQFNKGFRGLLDVLNQAQIQVGVNTVSGFAQLDEERINESTRHSLSEQCNSSGKSSKSNFTEVTSQNGNRRRERKKGKKLNSTQLGLQSRWSKLRQFDQ